MTSVIIVEDSTQLAHAVAHQLENWHGYSVTCVKDPIELARELQRHRYDVALVDLLFEHLNREFDERRRAGRIRLASPTLLITGLTALKTVHDTAPTTRTVVWTSGEANRRLHILYAYEQLGERVFCSKSSGTERANAVAEAIEASIRGAEHIDPVINSYLPKQDTPRLSATVLKDESQRAVWRAVAIGEHTRAGISKHTGYAARYVGKQIPEMYAYLRVLDPGMPESHPPMAEVIRYAGVNWQFFLDDAVRQDFP